MNPAQNGIVDTVLLVVLSLGEAHALILMSAILIGEDDHEVLAREVLLKLVRQSLESCFI